MELVEKGTQLEMVLDRDNPSECDAIFGAYEGWDGLFLMIRRDDGNLTYIAERIIRAIHTYPKGAKGTG